MALLLVHFITELWDGADNWTFDSAKWQLFKITGYPKSNGPVREEQFSEQWRDGNWHKWWTENHLVWQRGKMRDEKVSVCLLLSLYLLIWKLYFFLKLVWIRFLSLETERVLTDVPSFLKGFRGNSIPRFSWKHIRTEPTFILFFF